MSLPIDADAKQQPPSSSAVTLALKAHGVVCGANEDAITAINRHTKTKAFRELHRGKAAHKAWRKAVLRDVNTAVAKDGANAMNSLVTLNAYLSVFGLAKEKSVKKARAALKRCVFINIYDLLAKRYDQRCSSLAELRRYSLAHKKIFPLKQAKDEGLKDFLKHILRGRQRNANGSDDK